jgi:hypothetical protein
MPNHYLTKSDFKLGRECPRKIYYRKMKYPSRMDEDPYMRLLAEGGYMVGEIAKMLYPEGIDIKTLDIDEALAQTQELLQGDQVILFEPAINWGSFLVRIDVLIKEGNRMHLIEVKSKSAQVPAGGEEELFLTNQGGIRTEWRPYLEDCAFQTFVLQNAFPHCTVRTSLLVPDKDAPCSIDGLSGQFKLERSEARRGLTVLFSGDRDAVKQTNLLRLLPVDAAVTALASEVSDAAHDLAQHVQGGISKADIAIGYHCKTCEYNHSNGNGQNGFRECWGAMGDVSPHMFDLFQLGRVKRPDKSLTADYLVRRGTVSLHDVPVENFSGAYARKQKIQIEQTRKNEEWIDPVLAGVIQAAAYPLHFIDFETSRTAVPPHAGLRPYELISFQWSCHTIAAPGQAPRHTDWINTQEIFPNLPFAESLRQGVGEEGTLVVWSSYEKSCLRQIAQKLQEMKTVPANLIQWLNTLVSNEARFLDMCDLARHHYYHPRMKGSHSIKAVLPAVWESNPTLRAHPWFSAYAGDPSDPYRTLPSIEIAEKSERVKEGTGAIRAYQDMLYGEHKDDLEIRRAWTQLLRRYCELDTMAMVIIWEHWRMRLGL